MPGKPFLYNRVIISSTSRQQQGTINTYLSNKYQFDVIKVLKSYQSNKEVTAKPEYVQFKQLFDNGMKDTVWDLYLHLIFGKKKAALPLSECLRKGYGTDKDDFLADLTLAIGAELGDQQSTQLSSKISQQIKKIAKQCLSEIIQHQLGMEGREMLWDEVMARGKAFAYFVEKVSQHSYYKTIQESKAGGMKYWSNFVEPLYYCLSEIDEEVSISGDSLNQE